MQCLSLFGCLNLQIMLIQKSLPMFSRILLFSLKFQAHLQFWQSLDYSRLQKMEEMAQVDHNCFGRKNLGCQLGLHSCCMCPYRPVTGLDHMGQIGSCLRCRNCGNLLFHVRSLSLGLVYPPCLENDGGIGRGLDPKEIHPVECLDFRNYCYTDGVDSSFLFRFSETFSFLETRCFSGKSRGDGKWRVVVARQQSPERQV